MAYLPTTDQIYKLNQIVIAHYPTDVPNKNRKAEETIVGGKILLAYVRDATVLRHLFKKNYVSVVILSLKSLKQVHSKV